MAATTEAWIKYYYVKGLKGPRELGEIGQQPLCFFDAIADTYFEDERGFIDQIKANPSNFLILPGPMCSV
jgi:hypothetical protein